MLLLLLHLLAGASASLLLSLLRIAVRRPEQGAVQPAELEPQAVDLFLYTIQYPPPPSSFEAAAAAPDTAAAMPLLAAPADGADGADGTDATGEVRSSEWHSLTRGCSGGDDSRDHTGKRMYQAGVQRCFGFLLHSTARSRNGSWRQKKHEMESGGGRVEGGSSSSSSSLSSSSSSSVAAAVVRGRRVLSSVVWWRWPPARGSGRGGWWPRTGGVTLPSPVARGKARHMAESLAHRRHAAASGGTTTTTTTTATRAGQWLRGERSKKHRRVREARRGR